MGHINDSRGSQWLPRCISGESSRQGAGGAGALTPYPRFPAAMPPRIEGTSREGICKIHGKAGSQWFGECILGSHTGAARGEGRALTPSPTFPAAAIPLRIEGTGRERHLQNPWRGGIPVAWRMHLGLTHGGRKGRGRGIGPLTWASRHRHTAPHRGNRQGKVFAKSMERRDPSGLANASWGHTRGSQGAGWGLGPLTWASRHRRGGLPIRSSEGDRPHMGQGGI